MWANNKIRMVITGQCNINCFYCHNEGVSKQSSFMSSTLIRRIGNTIAVSGTSPKISIVGGEPMTHPQVFECFEIWSETASEVSLTTNGLLLDESNIRALAERGCSKIRLGIDSIESRRSRPSHGLKNESPITRTVEAIRSHGVRLELNTVLTTFNAKELPYLIEYCLDRRISAKFFELVTPPSGVSHRGNGIGRAYGPSAEEFQHCVESIASVDRKWFDAGGTNDVYDIDGVEIRYCRYLHPAAMCWRSGTRVSPLGQVSSCMETEGFGDEKSWSTYTIVSELVERSMSLGCNSVV
jgi:cyclic pyranopterin phosphate synthase